MSSSNIFNLYPDSITNRLKLRGLLLDLFPQEKLKVNLILSAFDEGIIDSIQKSNIIDAKFFYRWKKTIIDNYGTTEINAEWVVDYYCKNYGNAVCGRKCTYEIENSASEKKIDVIEKAKQNIPLEDKGYINLLSLKEGAKIKQSVIKIEKDFGPYIDIKTLSCTVRKGYTSSDGSTKLKFAGEYTGSVQKQVLIMVMIYNANNELIGYSAKESIRKEFKGRGTFAEELIVPSDEYISKILVKLVLDPARF